MKLIIDDDYASDDESDFLHDSETGQSFDPAKHPTHAAVYANDIATLQTLIAAGHNVNDPGLGDSPLTMAVSQNRRGMASVLLEAGADPIDPHEGGNHIYTPLSVAVMQGHDEMARLLWTALPPERLAECEALIGCGFLKYAAMHDRTSLVEFLLDGWLPGVKVWNAEALDRALLVAARSWCAHVAVLLLDRVTTYTRDALRAALFAALDSKVILPYTLWHLEYESVDYTNQELLVKRLIEHGQFDPNMRDGDTPLIHYPSSADPNTPDKRGITPLQCISVPITKDHDRGSVIHEAGIHLLLEHGASVTAADHEGETPLHTAAFGAELRLFRQFLRLGTRGAISATNHHGETLLHYAAAGANPSVLRFLLESAGADLDVNAANSNGWTPLLCALALTGSEESNLKWTPDDTVEAASLLLSRGADAAAVTAEGWSALHCLARHRNKPGDTRFSRLTETLIQKGAPLRAEARGLKPRWSSHVGARDWQCWEVFPWGFRMERLAGAAKEQEGVFSAKATTPLGWARGHRAEAVEEVLLARGGASV